MSEPHYLERLNPQQRQAVTTLEGPLLVLAGAGSGKTGVLTRRIAYLLDHGVEADHILAVTFTNKAAGEMRERVVDLVGPRGEKVWLSTFHSSCGRILRKDAEHLGYTRRFSIWDDDDQIRVIRQIMADLGVDTKVHPPKRFLSRIDHYKNRMMGPDTLSDQLRARHDSRFLQVWRDYEDNLRAADAMDFNDLIGKVVQLFTGFPEVLAKWRAQFRYVLVDEYQDTNNAQYRLLRLLADEHRNLCVVGDDDQSIYGFRGADIANILSFQEDYPEAVVIKMEQNYRCSHNILAVANAVVAANTGRIPKTLRTEADPGPLINVLDAADPTDEGRKVAAAIRQLVSSGRRYDDIVLIYRTNRTARTFEEPLRRQGIPYRIIGGRGFYERREVRDALAFLRLVANPADDAAFLRVVNVPARGVGTKTLSKLRDEATSRGEPLLKAARASAQGTGRAAKALGRFVELMDELTSLSKTVHPAHLLTDLIDRSGYRQMLVDEGTAEAKERAANLHQLVREAQTIAVPDGASPTEALQGWLDQVALASDDEEEAPDGRVTLMTVHASKGLEFPVVFVVHMMEGQFPHQRSLESQQGLEEERRLAYVAFTRAKERLVISYCKEVVGGRKVLGEDGSERTVRRSEAAAPSRFLFDLPNPVCVGALPAPPQAEVVLDEEVVRAERRASFFAGHRARHADPGDRRLIEPESLDDLVEGAAVWHARWGEGTLERVVTRGQQVLFKVRFGSGPLRSVLPRPGELQLIAD